MSNKETLIEQLMRHEGFRTKPYRCSAGKLTIGYGRNLDDKGITKAEAFMMLKNDIEEAYLDLIGELPWFHSLPQDKKDVLINMTFNLGINGLLKFKKMLDAVYRADYKRASIEMLDSKWAKQVGSRAIELAKQMES